MSQLSLEQSAQTKPPTHQLMKTSTLGSLMASVLIANSVQTQNLIVNGGFESPVIPTDSRQIMTPTSWTAGGFAVILNGNSGTPMPIFPLPQEGQQFVSIPNSPAHTLSQQFTVTSEMGYVVRWFDSTGHEPESGSTPYSVAVLTETLQTVASETFEAFHAEGWIERSMCMTLSPSTYVLRFTAFGNGPGGTSPLFDNVSLVASAAPILCPPDITIGCNPEALVPVTFSVTATDECGPAPVVVCNPPSGSGFPIGATIVTCTATDGVGNQTICTFTVTRTPLEFDGFLPPVGGADATGGSFSSPLRTFKLKSTIPLKFKLSCDSSAVTTGVHTLQAIKWSNDTTAEAPLDATPTDAATTGDQFRFTADHWHFNLDTEATGMSVGKWQLIATMSDGSQHVVWVAIK